MVSVTSSTRYSTSFHMDILDLPPQVSLRGLHRETLNLYTLAVGLRLFWAFNFFTSVLKGIIRENSFLYLSRSTSSCDFVFKV